MAVIKLSAAANGKISQIADVLQRVQRIHGHVEAWATARQNQASLIGPVKSGFGALKREMMGAGLDGIAQLAGAMEIAASRGTNIQTKVRILRDGVASIRFQLELEQRAIKEEDIRKQKEADADEDAKATKAAYKAKSAANAAAAKDPTP
jgi:hypothetical protein